LGVQSLGSRVWGLGCRVLHRGRGRGLFPNWFGERISTCSDGEPWGAGGKLDGFERLSHGNGSSQGHDLALTGLLVPSSLDSGHAKDWVPQSRNWEGAAVRSVIHWHLEAGAERGSQEPHSYCSPHLIPAAEDSDSCHEKEKLLSCRGHFGP